MRGRVMALYVMSVQGTRPIGGPIVGYVAQHGGPGFCLAFCGSSLLAVGLPVWAVTMRRDRIDGIDAGPRQVSATE